MSLTSTQVTEGFRILRQILQELSGIRLELAGIRHELCDPPPPTEPARIGPADSSDELERKIRALKNKDLR